jgi:class 3 adenylate cyclase
MSMLFADAVGFSQLNDREVPLFIDHFLGLVAGCVNTHAGAAPDSSTWQQSEIPVRETWGDGLFFAFRNVATAGRFAFDLCDAVRQTNWQDELDLSHELKIRSDLHTGPVRLGTDPITGLPKCIGTHVCMAARL